MTKKISTLTDEDPAIVKKKSICFILKKEKIICQTKISVDL